MTLNMAWSIGAARAGQSISHTGKIYWGFQSGEAIISEISPRCLLFIGCVKHSKSHYFGSHCGCILCNTECATAVDYRVCLSPDCRC